MSSAECPCDFRIGPHWLTGFWQNPYYTAYRWQVWVYLPILIRNQWKCHILAASWFSDVVMSNILCRGGVGLMISGLDPTNWLASDKILSYSIQVLVYLPILIRNQWKCHILAAWFSSSNLPKAKKCQRIEKSGQISHNQWGVRQWLVTGRPLSQAVSCSLDISYLISNTI